MRRTLARLAKAGAWAMAAVVGLSGLVLAWNKPPEPRLVLRDPAGCRVLNFSPDGRLLTTLTADQPAIHVWDTTTGERRMVLPYEKDRLWMVWEQTNPFSPSGRWLYLVGEDCFRLWESDSGEIWEIKDQQASIQSWAFSPDEQWLAMAAFVSGAFEIQVWNLATRTLLDRIPYRWNDINDLLIQFAPDSRSLLISDDNGSRLWD